MASLCFIPEIGIAMENYLLLLWPVSESGKEARGSFIQIKAFIVLNFLARTLSHFSWNFIKQ